MGTTTLGHVKYLVNVPDPTGPGGKVRIVFLSPFRPPFPLAFGWLNHTLPSPVETIEKPPSGSCPGRQDGPADNPGRWHENKDTGASC